MRNFTYYETGLNLIQHPRFHSKACHNNNKEKTQLQAEECSQDMESLCQLK